MKIRKYILFVAFASIIYLIGVNSVSAGNAIIWDSMVKETKYKDYFAFADSLAWGNRANWKQVPYGTTNYAFEGDPILENGNFWFHLQSGYVESPMLFGNLLNKPAKQYTSSEKPGEGNILYGTAWYSDGTGIQNTYARNFQIIKNQADEVTIKAELGEPWKAKKNIAQFRVKANTGWLEATPQTDASYAFGDHSGPHRFAAAPPINENSNDFVHDPKAPALKCPNPAPTTCNEIRYIPSTYKYGIFALFSGLGQNYAVMVIPKDVNSAKLMVQTYKSMQLSYSYQGLGQITAMKTTPTGANNAVYYGVVNQMNVFRYEIPNIKISSGGSYTASFHPAIAGKWRVSGRVNGVYYTQTRDVAVGGNLVFTSSVAGTLESVTMYLYDRNSQTPINVNTPQDIYRSIKALR